MIDEALVRKRINIKFSELLKLDENIVNNLIFRRSSSLSLTGDGFKILKTKIKFIYYPEKTDDLEMQYLLLLSKLPFPYYMTKKGVYLFSLNDAAILTLCGSIREWLKNYE